jgi:hypothetical protein
LVSQIFYRIYVYMTEEENMIVAINKAITKYYPKMVKDSKRICSYNADKWAEDLLSFHLAEFLTKKSLEYKYKVCVTDDALLKYMGRAMSMGLKSSASPFWHQIRKPMYNNRGIYEVDYEGSNGDPIDYEVDHINEEFDTAKKDLSKVDCVEWALEQMHYYDKALIEQYYLQNKTYNDIVKYYGIPHSAVVRDITKAVKKLQEHCQHFIV